MSDENAELKAEEAAVAAEEVIEIDEDETAEEGTWTEEVQMAGSQVFDFIKNLYTETTIRRIIVKNNDGDVLLNIPVILGVFGIYPPVLAIMVVGLGIALLTQCTVVIERVASKEEAAEAEATE